jgi:uncharacterized protein YndB with AHSA1/START domain
MKSNRARAVADVGGGIILATVDIEAPPERVFRALTTDEVTQWWGSDAVYWTKEWTADVRVGGAWRAGGRGADGVAFSVGGEYVEIDPPRKIVQTWKPDWDGGHVTTITYSLDPIEGGTRVTVRHEGFGDRAESCERHAQGWELVLGWLRGHASARKGAEVAAYFMCKLLPPRPSFMADMSDDERKIMGAHAAYWAGFFEKGVALAYGPVIDPSGPFGLGVLKVRDEDELRAFESGDPAITSGRGFAYVHFPMPNVVAR